MKSSAKIFYGLTVFMGIMAVIYILATRNVSDTGSVQGLEWAGATGLALAAGLTLMLGAYFHFTERRIDILPQDWEEAEIEDGAGMLGFFSPGSIWPFVMCVGIGIMPSAVSCINHVGRDCDSHKGCATNHANTRLKPTKTISLRVMHSS